MDLKSIILSERSQTQKTTYYLAWFHLYEILEKAYVYQQKAGQVLENINSTGAAQGNFWSDRKFCNYDWWVNDSAFVKTH